MDTKKHYKLYKDGKKWCVMTIAAVASVIGLATAANADDVNTSTSPVQTTQVAGNSVDSSTISATSANAASTVASEAAPINTETSQNDIASDISQNTVSSETKAIEENVAAPVASTAVQPQAAEVKNGWVNENNNWTYYNNGQVTSGRNYSYLPTINGEGHSWYLVDNGIVQSGVQKWAGTYYDFDANNNYQRVDNNYVQSQWGSWYLFGNDGRILSGLQTWKGQTYYFDPVTFTKVVNQDVTVNGTKYHLDNDGVAKAVSNVDAKVDKALSQRGVPYVWGGNTPAGFDCSGLVQWAYGLGPSYRTTYQQATLGAHKHDVMNAPKGSLLFFGSDNAPYHVAISLGDSTYVHAPEPGDVVKIGYSKYFTPSFYITM